MTGIRVEGVTGVLNGLARIQARIEAATVAATLAASAAVEAETKRKLSTYSHARGTPTPSPPGQPPATVTGTLRRSVRHTAVSVTGGTAESSIGPTAAYARVQELGGATGRGHRVHLPPRPYLSAAFRTLTDTGAIRKIYRDAWSVALTKH